MTELTELAEPTELMEPTDPGPRVDPDDLPPVPGTLRPETKPGSTATADPDDATLRIAHLLLRTGNFLPARVHLETLAGRDRLQPADLLDLAESRWRTGDLHGAGEAVAAYLDAGGDQPLGHLIAAEAAMAQGRPGEARSHARHALDGLSLPLDAVFAGQPRSSIWPHDPAASDQSQPPRSMRQEADFAPVSASIATARGQSKAAGTEAAHDAPMPDAPMPDAPMPDAQAELDAGREALASGDPQAAAIRLAIVLRISPVLAPAVLDLIGTRPGPEFHLLRGDALRLVGHEAAAERAFAAAADALRSDPSRSPE